MNPQVGAKRVWRGVVSARGGVGVWGLRAKRA